MNRKTDLVLDRFRFCLVVTITMSLILLAALSVLRDLGQLNAQPAVKKVELPRRQPEPITLRRKENKLLKNIFEKKREECSCLSDSSSLDISQLLSLQDAITRVKENEAICSSASKIEVISHQIWPSSLTEDQSLDEVMEILKQRVSIMDLHSKEWTHNLWVTERDISRLTSHSLRVPALQIRSLKELSRQGEDLEKVIELSFEISQSFGEEFLKWRILEEYGGVFFDLQFSLYSGLSLLDLHHCSELFSVREGEDIMGGIVGAKAKHELVGRVKESLSSLILNYKERPHFCSRKNDLKALITEGVLFEWIDFHRENRGARGSVLLDKEKQTRIANRIIKPLGSTSLRAFPHQ